MAAVKTIAAIHGEALRLWLKGTPMYRRESRPYRPLAAPVSVDLAARAPDSQDDGHAS